MLPSMYSPIEPEAFPPDVCYSGDVNHPAGWSQEVESELPNSDVKSTPDTDVKDSVGAVVSREIENCAIDNLEGAIGGVLPDLCVTSTTICELDEEVSNNYPECPSYLRDLTHNNEQERRGDDSNLEDESGVYTAEKVKLDLVEEEVDDQISYESPPDDFLIHNCKNISLVPCGTGDIHPDYDLNIPSCEPENPVCSELHCNVCCDKIGAFDEICDLQIYGLQLVQQNLLQSSDPCYFKWECSAMIPDYSLPEFSLHSHGTSLGSDVGSAYIIGVPLSQSPHHLSGEEEPPLSEEEQIKIAKRYGLITHLPCRVFDGSTKTRECVICMIDFSVGDKVRYLPCMHTYHTECIDNWLMRSFTCPSCLEPVDAALLSTYETS